MNRRSSGVLMLGEWFWSLGSREFAGNVMLGGGLQELAAMAA